jgi:hypothetical protein
MWRWIISDCVFWKFDSGYRWVQLDRWNTAHCFPHTPFYRNSHIAIDSSSRSMSSLFSFFLSVSLSQLVCQHLHKKATTRSTTTETALEANQIPTRSTVQGGMEPVKLLGYCSGGYWTEWKGIKHTPFLYYIVATTMKCSSYISTHHPPLDNCYITVAL